MKDKLQPIHPGSFLLEDFMEPLNLSISDVARALKVQPITVSMIIKEKRSISADMALRLAKWSKVSASVWMGFQSRYDLETAELKFRKIEKTIKPLELQAA